MARMVVVGSAVRIEFGKLDEGLTVDELGQEWHVVDPSEADYTSKRVSVESPLGAALIGRRVGDYCAVKSPQGTYGLTILDVT